MCKDDYHVPKGYYMVEDLDRGEILMKMPKHDPTMECCEEHAIQDEFRQGLLERAKKSLLEAIDQ